MNLNQLRVFHAVAQAGSVSGAARTLHVSQPAISKQLAELEESVGAPLVDRLPRGVRLTRVGRALEEHAARLFAVEREAEAELDKLLRGQTARLAVGASTTIGSYLVPRLFGELRRLHPEAHLSLEIGNTAAVHELVQSDRVDLGLTEGLVLEDNLSAAPFSEDDMIAITAPGDPLLAEAPVPLARFLERPVLMRERGSGTREVVESALAEQGFTIEPVLELGSTEAVKNAVVHRLGVAFVSSLTIDLDLRTGRLVQVRLTDFALRRKLHRVELRHRTPSPLLVTFKSLLSEPPHRSRSSDYAI